MTDDLAHDSGYPEKNQPPPYEGDYGSFGDANGALQSTLESMLHEMKAPSVRPKAQIKLTVAAGGNVSDIFSTHVRYYIEFITILQAPAVVFDLKVGSAAAIQGLGSAALIGGIPVSLIIDAGADIQLVSQAGAAIYPAVTSVLLVGYIID
jgi:hypothetical protein